MKEYPHSISLLFYGEYFTFDQILNLAHSVAQIAGFSLKYDSEGHKDSDGYYSFSMKSVHTNVDRELEADFQALRQVSPNTPAPILMTVGRLSTTIGPKYVISLTLSENLPGVIIEQLDDFMMGVIIACDRLVKLDTRVDCSIVMYQGNCSSEQPFVLYRSELLEMFANEIT